MGKRLPRKCQKDANMASGVVHKIKKPKITEQQKKRLDKLILLKVMKSLNPQIKEEPQEDCDDEFEGEQQKKMAVAKKLDERMARYASRRRRDDQDVADLVDVVCSKTANKPYTFECKNENFPTIGGPAIGWQAICEKAEKFLAEAASKSDPNSKKVIEVVHDSYESEEEQISSIVERLDVEKENEIHNEKMSILAKAFNRINQITEIDSEAIGKQGQPQQDPQIANTVTREKSQSKINNCRRKLTFAQLEANANKKLTLPTSTPRIEKKIILHSTMEESPILPKCEKTVCRTCRFVFENTNKKMDKEKHIKYHKYFTSFYWKICDTEVTNTISETTKIEKVVPNHPKAWKVLKQMLNCISEVRLSEEELANLDQSTGFILLENGIVYGILLAKKCEFGYKMLDIARDLVATEKQNVQACIYYIWVYEEKRNQKIATYLLNAFRTSYKNDTSYLLNEDFAFSLKTNDAKGFLAAYFRNLHYFVTS